MGKQFTWKYLHIPEDYEFTKKKKKKSSLYKSDKFDKEQEARSTNLQLSHMKTSQNIFTEFPQNILT